MPNYRSLVGGFYSSTPNDKSTGPVSVRFNNPGAVNGATWERTFPGHVGEIETTPGNRSTIFETPEHGVAAWWELMRRYRAAGANTVGKIIARYGGGQDYSAYAAQVSKWTGFPTTKVIDLQDDTVLLPFAKAMFRYEAGRETPLSEAQILYGFRLGRALALGQPAPPIAQPASAPAPVLAPAPARPWWARLIDAMFNAIGPERPKPKRTFLTYSRDLQSGGSGPEVAALQTRLQEIGYRDLNVDGVFGPVTETAVRSFQTARNLDPDGEVGELTIAELNKADAATPLAPLLPPMPKHGDPPQWYKAAEDDIGFHETSVNRGIEKFIASAKTGSLGDPWCAIWVNAKLEDSGVRGSRSPAARSFESNQHFMRLPGPALGAITTMWRTSKSSGLGHVFFYDGENESGIRGIGANEDDEIKRSFHDRSRVVGYFWPKVKPVPAVGAIVVSGNGSASREA